MTVRFRSLPDPVQVLKGISLGDAIEVLSDEGITTSHVGIFDLMGTFRERRLGIGDVASVMDGGGTFVSQNSLPELPCVAIGPPSEIFENGFRTSGGSLEIYVPSSGGFFEVSFKTSGGFLEICVPTSGGFSEMCFQTSG